MRARCCPRCVSQLVERGSRSTSPPLHRLICWFHRRGRTPRGWCAPDEDADDWLRLFVSLAEALPAAVVISDMTLPGAPMVGAPLSRPTLIPTRTATAVVTHLLAVVRRCRYYTWYVCIVICYISVLTRRRAPTTTTVLPPSPPPPPPRAYRAGLREPRVLGAHGLQPGRGGRPQLPLPTGASSGAVVARLTCDIRHVTVLRASV